MIDDKTLDLLIGGLQEYKDNGTSDPWILSNGSLIEPLDTLKELRDLRGKMTRIKKEIPLKEPKNFTKTPLKDDSINRKDNEPLTADGWNACRRAVLEIIK